MAKTWFRCTSDGTYFRNCPLIREEMAHTLNPLTRAKLDEEWWECYNKGVIKADSIGRRDKWIEHDDSPEANAQWVKEFLAKAK